MSRRPKSKRNSARKKSRGGLRIFLILLLLLVGAGLFLLFGPNTGISGREKFAYIRSGSDYAAVRQMLIDSGLIGSATTFDLAARVAGYPAKIRPGRYRISSGMSNYALVRLLGSGRQTPVKLTITKLRTKSDLIRLLSSQLEPGPDSLHAILDNPAYLRQFGLDTATVLAGVIPNTYELYWTTGADKAFRKIQKGYSQFWNESRRRKATALGLEPVQVSILASIVEEEYAQKSERGTIASVYLNRLAKGMKLQADPTAKFAAGDFALRRITSAQTGLASPWNTYHVSGLPVGPICTPAPGTVDAVLDAPKTDYLFFAARPDRSGFHNFSATFEGHSRNARDYHQSLNERNIH